MKLNLGSGNCYVSGWINVDWETPHRVDERVDLRGPLPWPDGSVSLVYAGHVFEHLTYGECCDLAKRLLACMARDGRLVVVSPDIEVAERMVADGTFDDRHHSLESLRHGAGRWAGDVHQWETTAQHVVDLLRGSGWPTVTDRGGVAALDDYWPVFDRKPKWQLAVEAIATVGRP
jgi:hypothetical protein